VQSISASIEGSVPKKAAGWQARAYLGYESVNRPSNVAASGTAQKFHLRISDRRSSLCTLYGARCGVIKCPSVVNDNFSCYEKLDHLHFGPFFSGDDAGFLQ